jgi:Xaa-Pro aminopeptidase
MRRQTDRFIKIIPSSRSEAVVLTDPENVRYVTGVPFLNGCVLGHNGKIRVFTDLTWYSLVKQRSEIESVYCAEKSSWIDALVWLKKKNVRVLKADFCKTSLMFRRIAETILPVVTWVHDGDRITSMRAIKTAEEISCIKDAVAASDEANAYLKTILKDGISEVNAARLLDRKLMNLTGEPPCFNSIVAFGENTSYPHWRSSGRTLTTGDTILVDWGACVNGYGADLTRVYFWKTASAHQRKRYQTVKKVLQILIEALKPGLKAADLDASARNLFSEYGLEGVFLYPLGHGLGLDIHESPYFCMDSEDRIMINMVFTLEPGLYIPEWGGIRLEETILMAPVGPSVLSGCIVEDVPLLK